MAQRLWAHGAETTGSLRRDHGLIVQRLRAHGAETTRPWHRDYGPIMNLLILQWAHHRHVRAHQGLIMIVPEHGRAHC
jgi:hypothetical protein